MNRFIVQWTDNGIIKEKTFKTFTEADSLYDDLIDEMIETEFEIDNLNLFEIFSDGKRYALY